MQQGYQVRRRVAGAEARSANRHLHNEADCDLGAASGDQKTTAATRVTAHSTDQADHHLMIATDIGYQPYIDFDSKIAACLAALRVDEQLYMAAS